MLKMRTECKTCSCSLAPAAEVYICSYECTYCASCRDANDGVCPACDGDLQRRPIRKRSPAQVAAHAVATKLRGSARGPGAR